jgi:hypothetical protein
MSNTIKFIRGAEADIPVLNQGEPAFTTDTHKVFIGDGAENHQLAGIDDAGEVNTASNIGNEVEIFKQKSTYDLEFRTLKANSDKIIISSEGEGDPIDIGTQGVDPGYHPLSLAQTFIAGGNPVLKSGNIDTLVVSSWADLTGVKLIAFEKVGTNDFTAKRYQSIGTITAGTEVEVEVDLDVLEGEYLGIWGTGGSFKTQETGGVGLWSHVGDQSEGEDVTFSLTSGYEIYLYGTGTGDPATLDYVKFDVNAEAVLADLTLTEADISDLGAYLVDVADDTSPTLGGNLDAADKYITGAGRISFTQELDNGTKDANFSVYFITDQKQKVTLTANTITLTLDTTSMGVGNYLLKIVNGGLATLTWASESGSIYFPGGTDPVLTASGTDIVAFYFDGTNWYGMASLDFK